jgi:hypothetical protein
LQTKSGKREPAAGSVDFDADDQGREQQEDRSDPERQCEPTPNDERNAQRHDQREDARRECDQLADELGRHRARASERCCDAVDHHEADSGEDRKRGDHSAVECVGRERARLVDRAVGVGALRIAARGPTAHGISRV